MPLSNHPYHHQKQRNPLQELPLTDFSRPLTPSSSSASASAAGTSRTPSSVSSFLSTGSTSASTSGSGVGTSGSGGARSGRSGRIVHLPLPDLSYQSVSAPSSSRRTVRPSSSTAINGSTTQPLGENTATTTTIRRWPVRASSPSGTTLTPGRLPPLQQPQHNGAGMAASSPLRPRVGATTPPTTVGNEERRHRREALMRELDEPEEEPLEQEDGGVGEDVEMEHESVEGTSRSGTSRERISGREKERRDMPPPPPPPPIHTQSSPFLSTENGTTPRPVRQHPSMRGTTTTTQAGSSLMTPGRSPARRLFTSASTAVATPALQTQTPDRISSATRKATLQPSPPLGGLRRTSPNNHVNAHASGSGSASAEKTKPRARTSTGRESPSPIPPPTTSTLPAPISSTEQTVKKARIEPSVTSLPASTTCLERTVTVPASSSLLSTSSTTVSAQPTSTEEQLKKRLENADPHDCGFTVWQDTSRGGARLPGSTASAIASSSTLGAGSTATTSSMSKGKGPEVAVPPMMQMTAGAETKGTMAEKNKAAFAWLSSISSSTASSTSTSAASSSSSPATGSGTNLAIENQENIKPPRSRLVPFVLSVDGKGKGKGKVDPAGAGGCAAAAAAASGSGSGTSSSSACAGISSVVGNNSGVTTNIPPPSPSPSTASRTPVAPLPRLLVPLPAARAEVSIRSSMRGSVPPLPSSSNTTSTIGTAAALPTSSTQANAVGTPTSRSAPVETLSTTISSMSRPVLVLRRTGSVGNVSAIHSGGSTTSTVDVIMTRSTCTGTVKATVMSAQEQENDVLSLVSGTAADKEQKRATTTSGRKKRKSEEMMLSSTTPNGTDGSSPVKKRSSLQTPPTTNAQPTDGSLVQNRARERRAARRSLGGNRSSGSLSGSGREGGREKKPGRKVKGKAGEDGYQGRVLRSMTRAGNGL